jgi:hypothetical protein
MADPMTVDEAKRRRVCRVCEQTIHATGPVDWPDNFGMLVWPETVTLNFGEEFAHTACLEGKGEPVSSSEPRDTGGGGN